MILNSAIQEYILKMWAQIIRYNAGGLSGNCAHGKGASSSYGKKDYLIIAATQDGLCGHGVSFHTGRVIK
jgi:hypothetical protein